MSIVSDTEETQHKLFSKGCSFCIDLIKCFLSSCPYKNLAGYISPPGLEFHTCVLKELMQDFIPLFLSKDMQIRA